ncbi:hypothetical protein JW948_08295 [bacterium]|nr:hypothetical protein [bacterium]
MTSLNMSTDEIHGLLKIMNDISGKINLLGLNAFIEAARAGDVGRGFAVVAGEIQNLATHSQNQIAIITKTLKKITGEIGNTSEKVE